MNLSSKSSRNNEVHNVGYLPKIEIATQENITLTTPGAPAILAVVGTAKWGDMNTVQSFSSYATLLQYFKADKSGLTLAKATDLAYMNGASTVKCVRIGAAGAAKSVKSFAGAGAVPDVITVSAKYKGTYGDNVAVTILTKGSGRTMTVTDGKTTEYFTNNNNANGYASNAEIAAAVNLNSSLATIAVNNAALVTAVTLTYLTGGNDGVSGLAFSDVTTAFDNVLKLEDFDILLLPEWTSDADHATMVAKLDARAATDKKFAIFMAGPAVNESIATQKARTSVGSRLALCSPNAMYKPSYATVAIQFDGTYLAAAVAGQIARRDVESAVTRKSLTVAGIMADSTVSKKYYTNDEMEELLGVGIIPVSLINGEIKVARGVTRVSDLSSVFYELNIQRIVDYVKAQVNVKLDPFLGEANLDRVLNRMARVVDGVLQQDVLDEVLAAYNPTEVVLGVSPDTVNVNMSVQPTFAINFINVTLAITRI